jgi:class 3 adenylate cyclase
MASLNRSLVAILLADAVGYSRMIAADELAAMESITACRRVLDGLLRRYNGVLVQTAGDGMLVTFASVVNALHCAVDFQSGLKRRNQSLPVDRRVQFRIGINIDDIIIGGDELHGDGINVAARLEQLAEPGGICVSDAVFLTARHKVWLDFECLGEKTLKNLPDPINVYRILVDEEPTATAVTWRGKVADDRIWVFAGEDGKGQRVRLVIRDSELRHARGGIVIGRNPKLCNIIIDDESLSRCHARLSLAGGELYFEDLDSSNGTVADDIPVRPFEPARLQPGSSIRMGQVNLRLSLEPVSPNGGRARSTA